MSCEMVALNFGTECTYLRCMDSNVIKYTSAFLLMTPLIVLEVNSCQWKNI